MVSIMVFRMLPGLGPQRGEQNRQTYCPLRTESLPTSSSVLHSHIRRPIKSHFCERHFTKGKHISWKVGRLGQENTLNK